jgi:hypothetical protein
VVVACLHCGEQCVETSFRVRDAGFRVRQYSRLDTQPAGDRQTVRSSWNSLQETVCGAETYGIELKRSINNSLGVFRQLFQ